MNKRTTPIIRFCTDRFGRPIAVVDFPGYGCELSQAELVDIIEQLQVAADHLAASEDHDDGFRP